MLVFLHKMFRIQGHDVHTEPANNMKSYCYREKQGFVWDNLPWFCCTEAFHTVVSRFFSFAQPESLGQVAFPCPQCRKGSTNKQRHSVRKQQQTTVVIKMLKKSQHITGMQWFLKAAREFSGYRKRNLLSLQQQSVGCFAEGAKQKQQNRMLVSCLSTKHCLFRQNKN